LATKLAYLVGIEKYDGLIPAVYARNDVRRLGEALSDYCGFRSKDVHDAGEMALNNQIVKWLKDKKGQLQPEDTFLFYFAGHGLHEGGESFLLGYNASNEAEKEYVRGMRLQAIIESAGEMGAGQTIVICDCCREDMQSSRGPAGDGVPESIAESMAPDAYAASRKLVAASRETQRHIAILLGCSPGQRTYAHDRNPQGAFTSALLYGLKGEAVASDGSITMYSLADYISRKLARWSDENPGRPMTPHFTIYGHIALTPPRPPQAPGIVVEPERFQFSDGVRVSTIEAWLAWLLDHPEAASAELRNCQRLQLWLERFVSPQTAAHKAERLNSQSDGLWKELLAFAYHAKVVNQKLLNGLAQLERMIPELLKPSHFVADYFTDKAALEEAARLDPHSSSVADARVYLEQRLRSLANGRKRQQALEDAKHLAASGQWAVAIQVLRAMDSAGRLGAAETRSFDNIEGPPKIVMQERVEFIWIPAGIFRMRSGRIAGMSSFRISKRPVLVRDYVSTVGTPSVAPVANPGFRHSDKAIVMVTWNDAELYCQRRGGCLPSEAQWEFARHVAAAQGNWPPLAEWCRDLYRPSPSVAPAMDPFQDYEGALSGNRVVREGPTGRSGRKPDEIAENLSFRLVLPGPPA
jgi:hypothetical protein